MAMIGGDLAQMQSLSQQLTKAGQEVQALQNTVTNGVMSTQWEGPAATRFKEAWNGQYKTSLKNLQDALDALSREVKQRRDELERVSA